MAAVRVVADADSWSLSRGLKDYFACCFASSSSKNASTCDKQQRGAAAGGDGSTKKLDAVGGGGPGVPLSPSPRTTQRVRCSHRRRSLSEDEEDGETEFVRAAKDVSSSPPDGTTRLEADGASVHSAGTDPSVGRASGASTRSEQAIREGLESMLAAAGDSLRTRQVDVVVENGSGSGGDHLVAEDRLSMRSAEQRGTSTELNGKRSSENSVEGELLQNARSRDGVDGEAGRRSCELESLHNGALHGTCDDELSTGTGNTALSQHDVTDHSRNDDELDEDGGLSAGHARSLSGSERVFVDEATSRHSSSPAADDQHSRSPPNVHFADDDEADAEAQQQQQQQQRGGAVSTCGSIRTTLRYDKERRRLTLGIHEAVELPSEDRGGAGHTQVHVVLLPAKKLRHKTRVRPGSNTSFDESFEFKIQSEDLNSTGLRVRLYGCERLRRERLIGEAITRLSAFDLLSVPTTDPQQHVEYWFKLEPRSNISHGDSLGDLTGVSPGLGGSAGSLSVGSDSGSSSQSLQHGGMPELMIGLAYNGTTGRLSVEVIKGSNFKNMAASRPPDTSVKLALMSPQGEEITHSKTSVRRGQPNPLFKETFMFQIPQTQLPDVSLMVSIYATRSLNRKEMIGWFTLGLTNSSDEELQHWTMMRESQGEQICRWHLLLEP